MAEIVEKANEVIEFLDHNEQAHLHGDSESATASHEDGLRDEQSPLLDNILILMGSIATKLAGFEQKERSLVQEGPEIKTPYESSSDWFSANVEQVEQVLVQEAPTIRTARTKERLSNFLSVSKGHENQTLLIHPHFRVGALEKINLIY